MDLTQYKLEELIENSKLQINTANVLYKNLKLFSMILAIEALILCPVTWNFINPAIYLWIVAIAGPIKTSFNLIIPKIKKKRANKKLEEVVELLKQQGIKTSRTRLQRAKVASNYLKCIVNEDGATMTSRHIIIFRDKEDQIKALKQARVELLSFHIPFRHSLIGESRIIQDETSAEKIYLQMKKR